MRQLFVIGIVSGVIAAAGCVTEDGDSLAGEPATDEVSAEVGVCRVIQHYDYVIPGSVFRWDVTFEDTGRVFVDERRIGGGFYRQYRVTPTWSSCPHPNELLTLRGGGVTLVGSHNCLDDGREEFHGNDRQRLLVPRSPFITFNCDP